MVCSITVSHFSTLAFNSCQPELWVSASLSLFCKSLVSTLAFSNISKAEVSVFSTSSFLAK
nr:MAG TPA: hypothetical protein [Caudoviricetes sp.]